MQRMAGRLDAVASVVIERAEEGDMTAAKMVLDRLAPIPRERPVSFAMRRIEKSHDAAQAASDVLAGVADGKITIAEADRVLKLLRDFMELCAAHALEKSRVWPPSAVLTFPSETRGVLELGEDSQEFERRPDESLAEFEQRAEREARQALGAKLWVLSWAEGRL